MARDDAGTPQPRPRRPQRRQTLPEDHLALIVEDALAAADAALRQERSSASARLRAAILYGWTIGAAGARDLVARAGSDPGLGYLFGGVIPTAEEVHAFRTGNRGELEEEYGNALGVCRGAGIARLGTIALPKRPARGRRDSAPLALARDLLDRADAVDAQDEQRLDPAARENALPIELAERDARKGTFARLAGAGPLVRAPHPALGIARGILSGVLTLALVLGGFLVIRWVGSANAEVNYAGQARVPVVAAPPQAPADSVPRSALTPPTFHAEDLLAASQEGIRLGILALAEDDLRAARDFFFLAAEAAPDNPMAADRLRQAETALAINSRTDDLEEAVRDLGELRRLAPGAPSVRSAYVTALVRAGSEAITAGEVAQASQLCAEARRWLPNRPDVANCMSPPVVVRSLTAATPTPPRLPTPALPTGTPAPAQVASPTQTSASILSSTESNGGGLLLSVELSGGCHPAPAGARSIQVSGSVTGAAGVPAGAMVQVRITDPAGRVLDGSSFPLASQRFAVQRTTAGGGPRTVSVVVSGVGYAPGEAALTVSC
jgi:hypothetical protein